MLICLNIDNVTNITVNNSFFNSVIKRSISKYMANHNFRIVFLCTVDKLSHFFFIYSKWFFKKHIISCI